MEILRGTGMISLKKITVLVFSCLVLIHSACGQVPGFDPDRAFSFLEKQCAFGPRNPGSEGHKQCRKYLVDQLRADAGGVVEQPFLFTDPRTSRTHTLTNIIASFGQQKERILLCAHWDTRPVADHDPDPANRDKPITGANDGASGVAVLLAIAEILKINPPDKGVDIILFDGEDSGIDRQEESWCQGSRFFARNKQPGYRPEYGLLLDMIGERDLMIPVEQNSQTYAPSLVDRVWSKAGSLGLEAFSRSRGFAITDDHLELIRVGIPTVDIIDYDYPYWHTVEDTPDKCSPQSLGIVGTLVLNMIYE